MSTKIFKIFINGVPFINDDNNDNVNNYKDDKDKDHRKDNS